MISILNALKGFWHRNKKMILILLTVAAAAWLLGQFAVPAILKEIFLGGHIS